MTRIAATTPTNPPGTPFGPRSRAAELGGAVATLLTPSERQRVDAAGEGCYVAVHRESVDELLRDVRDARVHAVLVSAACYNQRDGMRMARLVREFPRVPAVALLSGGEQQATQALLSLGRLGVSSLVDVRDPRGWRELRHLITRTRHDTIERTAVTRILHDVGDAPADCRRFLELLFTVPPAVGTVRQFARRLGVLPSTFMSRFFRVGLPAPKRYLALARLVRAARLFENAGLSVSQVANRLEYSSPQSFTRHVQAMLRCTAIEFRRRYDGEGMLDRLREELILPHLDRLRQFHPIDPPPHWTGVPVDPRGTTDGPLVGTAPAPCIR